jgi:hypothetical protein
MKWQVHLRISFATMVLPAPYSATMPRLKLGLPFMKSSALYTILVELDTAETTYDPLYLIAEDDPISCAEYACINQFLDTPGCKLFQRLRQSEKKFARMGNQAKRTSYHYDPFWKFGVFVPRTHAQAIEIDRKNGKTKCQD